MGSRVNSIVYWNNYGIGSYLYGTTLKFDTLTKNVYYKHIMVNAGITIHEWTSQVNYQQVRTIPQLPLLERGKKYKLKFKASTVPKNTLYVKLEFYDIYNNLIETTFIKEKEGEFIYPNNSFSYKVILFNAGIHEMTFEYLQIADLDEDINEVIITKIKNINDTNNELNILFVDYSLNSINYISEEILAKFENLVIVNGFYSKICYNSNNVREKLLETIKTYSKKKVNFIGYTTISNIAALHYANIVENSRITIFNNINKFDKYIKIANKSDLNPTEIVESLEKLLLEKKVTLYGEDSVYNFDKKLVNSIIDYSYRLNLLDI